MPTSVISRETVLIVLLLLVLFLSGCASTPLDSARVQFEQGDYQAALQTLDENRDQVSDRDRLLLLMSRE